MAEFHSSRCIRQNDKSSNRAPFSTPLQIIVMVIEWNWIKSSRSREAPLTIVADFCVLWRTPERKREGDLRPALQSNQMEKCEGKVVLWWDLQERQRRFGFGWFEFGTGVWGQWRRSYPLKLRESNKFKLYTKLQSKAHQKKGNIFSAFWSTFYCLCHQILCLYVTTWNSPVMSENALTTYYGLTKIVFVKAITKSFCEWKLQKHV